MELINSMDATKRLPKQTTPSQVPLPWHAGCWQAFSLFWS